MDVSGGKCGRRGEIRTPDPILPKDMRYQAALHADAFYSSQPANTVNARTEESQRIATLLKIAMIQGNTVKNRRSINVLRFRELKVR